MRVELVLPAGTPDAWLPQGDTLRILVRRAGRVEPIVDTAGATDSLAAVVTVPLDQAVERFVATAELVYGGQVMFLAFEAVQLRAALDTTIVLTAVYVGPGGAAASLTVAAADSTLEGGDTTTVVPTALDSIGQSLGRVPVRFRSLRPDLFTVDTTGFVTALDGAPDTARVDVVMPTGLTASLPLWLVNALGPFTQTIAFISTRDGNRELYVMNDDGSGARRLTTTPDPESFPAWAPDRSAIVFERVVGDATEIFAFTPGDGSERQLTSDGINNSSPRYSPDGSRIAFTSRRGGRAEVWVMEADGGNQRRLLDPFADGSDLTFGDWSPDGRGLVFLRRPNGAGGWTEAWVSDSAGGNARMVLGPAEGAAGDLSVGAPGEGPIPDLSAARWGPLGGLVAYTYAGTDTVVLVLGLDQTGGSAVGDAGAGFIGHAAFAGADDRFVFESDADGVHAVYHQDAAGTVARLSPPDVAEYEPDVVRPMPAIYVDRIVISPDSVGLTSDEASQTYTASGVDANGQPVPVVVQWLAPSEGISQLLPGPPVETVALGVGKTYAIASYRGWRVDSAPITITPATGPTAQRMAYRIGDQIYTMRGDGTDTIRLTTPANGGYEPAFSPDGARIAWTNLAGGNGDLWMMNADGSFPTAVTSGTTYDAQPSWSPDGQQLVFSANRVDTAASQRQLWVVRLDGTGLRQLTFPPASNLQDVDPAWSPDGSLILFTRYVLGSGTSSMRAVDVTGGAERALAMPAGSYRYPAWVPDGTAFVYTRVNVGTFLEYLGVGRMPYPPSSETVLSTGTSPRGFAAGGHLVPSVASDGLIAFSSGLGVTVMRGDGTALSGLIPGGVPGNWRLATPPRYVAAVIIGGDVASPIAPAGTRQLTASATDQGGSPLVPVGGFRWTTLDPGVATVDSTGVVTGVAAGSARIVASSGLATPDTVTVTVGGVDLPRARTWAGSDAAGPTDWFVAGNWSPAGVPEAADTVILPGATDQPVLTAAVTVAALRITGGNLTLNGNAVTVTGNLSTEAGLGTLTMQQPGDVLTVQGDAVFAGGVTFGLLTDGVLYVAGDFEQRNVVDNTQTFQAFGSHRTVLNGSALQQLVPEGNLTFGHLEVANTGAGVQALLATTIEVEGTFTISTPTTFDGGANSLDVEGAIGTVAGSTLATPDLRLFSTLSVGGGFDVGTTEFAGQDQEIPALPYQDVRVSEQARLAASVTMSGSLLISGGSGGSSLSVNGHTLTVASLTTGGGGADPASLTMRNPSDVVVVTGDAVFDGDAASDRMTEGVLYIAGSLLDGGSAATGTALRASGNHRTVLNGSGLQEIRIANGSPIFHHLEIANTGPGVEVPLVGEGVEFTVSGKLVISTPVPFSGFGAYVDVGDSLVTVAGSAVVLGGLVLRGGIDVGGAFEPATIELAGTNQDIPPLGDYQGMVVSGTARLIGTTDVDVNLLIRGPQANLTLNGQRLTVASVALGGAGFPTGTLTMTDPADTLEVQGDLVFSGGNTAGLLTAGTVLVGGGFYQGENPAAFQPSGTHRTVLNGSTQQIVSFANPGTTGATSRFQYLQLEAAEVRFQTAAAVAGELRATGVVPQLVTGPGPLLSVGGVDVTELTLDGIALAVGAGTLARVDNVTFRNQDPTAVQLSVTHPGSLTPFTFTGVQFLTPPTTGYYISATDVSPGDGNVLTIDLASSQPLDGSARTMTAGGAIVNWPGSRTRTWLGGDAAGPTSWFVAGNWSPAGVPNASDSVVIPTTSNQPVVTADATVARLRITGGNLTLGGRALTVTGDFATEGGGSGGSLTMQDAADRLTVLGTATFAGAPLVGRLTAGTLAVAGTFTQAYVGSNWEAFQASGTHRTLLNGSAPQTVAFTNPGAQGQTSFFHHLELANAAGVAFTTNAVANGKLRVTMPVALTGAGTVTVADSLVTASGSSIATTGMRLGGGMDVAGTFSPTLTEFFGTSQSVQAGLGYQNMLLTGTASFTGAVALTGTLTVAGGGQLTLAGPTEVPGDLTVNDGALTLNGQRITVGGNLETQGTGNGLVGTGGRVLMQNPADTLVVRGSATFAGGVTTELLTAGVLEVAGDFRQLYVGSNWASFAASGTHTVVLNGTVTQTVRFDSPAGAPGQRSFFQDLAITNAAGITLSTAAVVNGTLRTGSAGAQSLAGTGNTLSVAGLDVDGLTLDNVPLSVGAGTLTRFDNVTFQNLATTATQLTIAHPGGTSAYTFSGVQFLTTPTTGYYVSATDAAPGDGNVLTIELAESQPADGRSRTVTSGGAVVTWLGTRPPPFAAMSSGQGYSCGLAVAGTPYCWGRNFDGSLGDGTTMERHVPTPVSGSLTLGGITAGWSHACGLTTAGAAYCWGSNAYGQLGDGTTANSLVPVAVQGGVSFTALAAGEQHTCGLTTAGAVYCWGGNGSGQLGDGTTTDHTTPEAVSGGLTFASVSPGGLHTCAVTTGGLAYCWGANTFGQLGDGTATQQEAPVAVSGGLTFSTVSATGASHTCGVTSGGAGYCWGWNGSGELGDGSTAASAVPVPVTGGLVFAAVSAGGGHTCGLTTSGSAYCWGLNDLGQLGDGTTTQRTSPVAVSGGLTFGSIDAGFAHVAAIAAGGAGYSWGSNTSGELGDGTTTNRTVPTLVAAPLP